MNRLAVLLGPVLVVLAGAAVPLAMGGTAWTRLTQPTTAVPATSGLAPISAWALPSAGTHLLPIPASAPMLIEPGAAPAVTQAAASPVFAGAPEAAPAPLSERSVDCHGVLGFAELRGLLDH